MKTKNIIIISGCLFFFSSVLFSSLREENLQNNRRIRDNIRTLLLLRMTQALDLTEEQTAKIFPKISRIEKEKKEIQQKIGKQMRELRSILRNENHDEQEFTDRIKRIKELRNLLKSKDEELENFLDDNLTLLQRAKYIIFSQDFYRGLREKLERARIMQERLRKEKKR